MPDDLSRVLVCIQDMKKGGKEDQDAESRSTQL